MGLSWRQPHCVAQAKSAGIAGTDMNAFVEVNKTSFVPLSIFHNGGTLNKLHHSYSLS